MSDSFFGFDAALPGEEDDGGGGARRARGSGGAGGGGGGRRVLGGGSGSGGGLETDSEEEYDALNDETFGQARQDDWEDLHENLVRMDQREGGDGDSGPDSDLDINFSSVGIDNFELDNDTEPEARLQLDPSVWTMPSKPEPTRSVPAPQPEAPIAAAGAPTPVPGTDRFGASMAPNRFPLPNPGQIRICSLEEIEQNMIKQQQEQLRRGMTPLPRPPPGFQPPSSASNQQPPLPPPVAIGGQGPPPVGGLNRPLPVPIGFPVGGPPPTGGPMFPPTNVPPPTTAVPPPPGPPFPFPINFQGPPTMPPPPAGAPGTPGSNNNNNNNNASFSQRLVEEIQQNHPMLPHYRQQPPPGPPPPLPGMGVPPPAGPLGPLPPAHGNFKHPFLPFHPFPPNWNPHNQPHHHHPQQPQQGGPAPHHGHHGHPGHHHFPHQQHHPGHPHHHPQQQQHHHHQHQQHHHHHPQQQQQQQGGHRLQNGKLNRNFEYDEYANMMSERAKHWLLGIQLSQLNKETAYYNDYYFCVFRDRKERERGAQRESKAHKDNTFYHPFTQQMLHRNGLIRERRNSDNMSSKDNIKEIQPRRYKPVQFENSLGKLQCGSVIAPRKIIDQDVVVDRSVSDGTNGVAGGAGGAGNGSSETVHHQRRSRQILLHVENLYRLLLRLEDLANPLAIEAKQQMKEKRAKEQLLAQEKQSSTVPDEQNNVAATAGHAGSAALVTVTPVSEVEQDTLSSLLERILPALNAEGVQRLLSVRKGKQLLTRIQKALSAHPARWTVWCTVLSTLVALPRRDRDDADEQLSPLFAQLELHVKYAAGAVELLPLFETLLNTDQLLGLVPKCKFLLLTILTLIAQMEQLATDDDDDEDDADDGKQRQIVEVRWRSLLRELARVFANAATTADTEGGNKTGTGSPPKVIVKLDSTCGFVKLLRAHLQRHPELDLERKLQTIVSIVDRSEPIQQQQGSRQSDTPDKPE
ncbi:protein PAT1 homolog 1-like [Anopheles bellator]|uniref:protein PAT1 homolog 1-like n=1 Tax=Anopheles bellator TaxID=139047 RepID=UPI00264929D0|nr:protein PAT1 homolog 1-like [Anopheles bellator]